MNGKSYSNSKKNRNVIPDNYKENKIININNIKTMQKKPSKNPKHLFINNDNHIESINIINNNINYKNIILQNLPSQNKPFNLNGKESSRNRKNIKTEKNILYDYNNNNINNNFQTIIPKKQKSLSKNNNIKLMLNRLEQENYNLNLNEYEVRFKLKLYEKNNIINKLKDELEYYKSYYHSMNPMSTKNTLMPNHNTINVNDNLYSNSIKRLSLGLEEKNKIIKTENMRNKIKNIFSLRKNDVKDFRNDNINLRLNIEKEGETINNSRTNKESALTIQNKSENKNRNKLIISNDILQLNKKNEKDSNNNVFFRSNSNTYNRKIKIGLHLSELNLEDNKFNSIEANRNHISYIKHIKNTYNKGINNKDNYEKDYNGFNYIQKFENLKNRMNNLVNNLFDLLEKNKNN